MNIRPRCSIAMASYNGEMYISEQIDSILKNMKENDELIISDDGSSDNTRLIIQDYLQRDRRITFVNGPQKGLIKNFENALKYARGEVVFLCDQDDVWGEDKIERILAVINEDITLVLHDAVVFDGEEVIHSSFMQHRKSKSGLFNNIIKNSYIGCCMAFRREILNYALPFPNNICMHDQWIGLVSELYGKNKHIEDRLLHYRRHGSNVSSMVGESIIKKIKNRCNMVIALIIRMVECKKHKENL